MTRRDLSESQSDALYRRDHTWSDAGRMSATIAWDWHKRQPRGLRDAADMIRRAYADEVPGRLHNRELADDGTPKMTPQAESYIFGSDYAGETPPDVDGNTPVLDYYRTPFRAALSRLRGISRPRADLIEKVATGSHQPMQAAIEQGVPPWCAKLVAEDVLFAFMRSLSDLKISLPPEVAA